MKRRGREAGRSGRGGARIIGGQSEASATRPRLSTTRAEGRRTAFISASSDLAPVVDLRLRSALRSLSSLILVMTTFEGLTGMGTVAPLPLSRETPSTKTRKFLRFEVLMRPSRPL